MGCITSKGVARSMSIREEISHGFHSTTAAWEELLTSRSDNDHKLFAFVRSSSKPSSGFTLPSIDSETATQTKSIATTRDEPLPVDDIVTEIKSTQEAGSELDFYRFTRSKSCHLLGENDGAERENENKLDWKDKNMTGSRSFHTVEEYDALLERIRKVSESVDFTEDYYSFVDVKLQTSDSSDEDQNNGNIHRIDISSSNQEDPSLVKMDSSENVARGSGTHKTGWKRKEIAKGLRSLDVPTVEFPPTARVKQWKQADGHVYSPGTYVTPKFGSYNAKVAPKTQETEDGDNIVFSPDLLAAFEDCMQQLQIEEDSILCHLGRHSTGGDRTEGRGKKVTSNLKADQVEV